MVLRAKHLLRLAFGLADFALVTRAWWVPAVVVALAIGVVAATATQATVPAVVYTLF